MTWEYCILSDPAQDELCRWGLAGWELVAVSTVVRHHTGTSIYELRWTETRWCYMKRPCVAAEPNEETRK